jgi:P27 family predicted phage terminase small subunit
MARPAKSTNTKTGVITKDEERLRKLSEARLKCGDDKLTPPDYLTDSQRDIFEYIQTELKSAEILGNLDIFVLVNASVAIDRMISIEKQIENDPALLFETKVMSARDKYSKDFFRCCNELCLSPQARAKLSIQNVKALKEEEDPLMEILGRK